MTENRFEILHKLANNELYSGINITEPGVFALGSDVSITCTSDFGVSSVEWLRDRQVVSSSTGSEGVLSIAAVNENYHGSQYTCRTTASFGTQERTINIQVEGIMHLVAAIVICD